MPIGSRKVHGGNPPGADVLLPCEHAATPMSVAVAIRPTVFDKGNIAGIPETAYPDPQPDRDTVRLESFAPTIRGFA
ncbi:MAG: hypothetical protein NVS4B3_09740 [Gemmatimonadaceae bacterium]